MHKYKRTLFGVLVVLGIAVAMSGFGLSYAWFGKNKTAAIKINQTEISAADIWRERRQMEENYRRMFGAAYGQFADTLRAKLNQELVDRIIADTLVQQEARRLNLAVGDDEAQIALSKQFPGGQIDPKVLRMYLQQINMSAAEFEQRFRNDLLLEQVRSLLKDASNASLQEIKALEQREKTRYTVNYVVIDPAALVKEIKDPASGDLEAFYNDRAAEFEIPAKVSYDYVVFDPAENLDLVQVPNDEIELYYTDNEDKFKTEEEAKVSHILLKLPPDNNPDKIAEIRKKAEDIHAKALAGEDFSGLASQNSEDLATKLIGGSLGSIKPGKMAAEFDAKVFGLKKAGIAPLIETKSGFYIVKVEEYIEPKLKPLDQVREQIVQEIKTREAPSFTAARAQELYDAWTKAKGPLADFAKAHNLKSASSGPALAREKEAEDRLKGLTAKVLDQADTKMLLIDLDQVSVLAEVKAHEEARTLSFAELSGNPEMQKRVLDLYKNNKAKDLARQRADDFIKDCAGAGFADAAKKLLLEVKEEKDFDRSKGLSDVLADSEVSNAIFKISQAKQPPSRSFDVQGKQVVFQVAAINPPAANSDTKELERYRQQAGMELTRVLYASLINSLKAKAKIDIDNSLLPQE